MIRKPVTARKVRWHKVHSGDWRTKKGVSYLYRTATTVYPCCLPTLGEFNRSWSYKTYPIQRYYIFFIDDSLRANFQLLRLYLFSITSKPWTGWINMKTFGKPILKTA